MQQHNKKILSDLPGPIGVFDSGYGGLTILRDLVSALPKHDFIYLGDNARTPYGTRSYDVVLEYTLEAVTRLFEMGCHLIILACNTASAKALRTIQQKHLPFIDPHRRVLGVIRPSVEIVGDITTSNHVGVFGTTGTIQSGSYPIEINKLHPELMVSGEACPMWVPLVENGEADSNGADYFIKQHIDNLLQNDPKVDTIILGCTHYPLLIHKIKSFMPEGIQVISQGPVIAESLKDYLKRHPEMDEKIRKTGNVEFFTTENPEKFNELANLFYNEPIEAQHITL
ncbi:glutamate racemase [Saccharicrinis sp. FJH62]|uniref:glutamate racemase n=1 Tax=Saccharicrinis sp. FJH62 TaxID=3344657 RepID=UPI0035D4128C